MNSKKLFVSLAVVGAAALLLAGCSGGTSDTSGSASSPAPEPSKTASVTASKPFNPSGLLAGNATPTFPDGEAGKVSVLAQSPLGKPGEGAGASLPIVYRNNTGKAISHVDFTGTARVGGKLVATGKSQGATPAQVQPGETGFAFIYFEDETALPDSGVSYAFTADTLPADKSAYNTAPLIPAEVANDGTSIVGTATNQTGAALTGPYSVSIYCFTGNDVISQIGGFGDASGDLAAGAQTTFSVALYDTKCDTFALGVSGYFS